ncbi:MAG: hypothetical protein ABSG68_23635, partial [Thermoguttaceae bacterium]
IPDRDADNKKEALYRAGKLAMGIRDRTAAEKYLSILAALDFTYRDVSALLDKLGSMGDNSGGSGENQPPPQDEPPPENQPPQDG